MTLIGLNFIIFLVLVVGRSLGSKNKRLHTQVTSVAIFADLILILFLVGKRDVLSKIEFGMPLLLMFHIFLSLVVVVAYGFAVYYGIQLGRGHERFRTKMVLIDKIIVPTRLLVFITILMLKWKS